MKTYLIPAILFSCNLLNVSGCFAQQNKRSSAELLTSNPMTSRLDSLVDRQVRIYFEDKKAVGLSLGIVINGKVFYYNYGETKYGNGTLPNNATIYELGSMTKTFTGILLAKAVLDKKIGLDDDIRKYLKGSYPNLLYAGRPVRIKDLANHTSRITRIFPNLWERKEYKEDDPYSNYTRALLFEGLHQMKLDTLPGSVYAYSNMAVGLLGCILEDVYGDRYFNLVYKNILAPLKMTATRVDLSGSPKREIAFPHNANREVAAFWNVPELAALGALRSTTADLVKYIRANNANKLPNIALSHQPTFGDAKEGMGLNWFIHTTPDGYQVLEHSGGTGGSRSSLQCIPELNSGFVLLSNSLANRNDLEKDLLAILLRVRKSEKLW